MAQSGNYKALLGEKCTLYQIRGVEVLEDTNGTDLLKMIKKGMSKTSDVDIESLILALTKRVDDLEKFIKNMPAHVPQEPVEVVQPKVGPQGPRGHPGTTLFKCLEDVFLDGVDDGMVPVWNSEKQGLVFEKF